MSPGGVGAIAQPPLTGCFSLQSGGAIVLTLSQTGSVFKPRKAHLPQELLGEVRPRRGSRVQPKTRLIAFGFWGFFLTSFQTWSKTTFLCSFTQVPKTLTLYHICLTLPLSLHLLFSE